MPYVTKENNKEKLQRRKRLTLSESPLGLMRSEVPFAYNLMLSLRCNNVSSQGYS